MARPQNEKGKVMSEETNSKPAMLTAFTVRKYKQGKEERTHWLAIGQAFGHKDGEGFDIVLQALPVDGRVVLRKPLPKETQEIGETAA